MRASAGNVSNSSALKDYSGVKNKKVKKHLRIHNPAELNQEQNNYGGQGTDEGEEFEDGEGTPGEGAEEDQTFEEVEEGSMLAANMDEAHIGEDRKAGAAHHQH